MKIVIVGGVAAGMSAAARARRLDENAEITVFERDQYVSFANCGLPYHISGEIQDRNKLLVITPQDLEATLNLNVHIHHEVTSIDREQKIVHVLDHTTGAEFTEPYDKLVLTTGSTPVRPPIPGVNHPKIFTLRTIPDMDAIKAEVDGNARSAIVIGGGFIGVEMAEALRMRGLRVTLVDLMPDIIPTMDHELDQALIYHMESYGVNLKIGHGVIVFEDVSGRVEATLDDGSALIADLVILAIGVRPENKLARDAGLELGSLGGLKVDPHMRTSDPDIYAAGDAVEDIDTVTGQPAIVALAGPANRQGRVIADHICGRKSAYTTTQGTSVLKVFDMTAGGTGATEKRLQELDIPYRKVHIHPNGHASYYPGTAPMHLKLLFAPHDGKILGAQVVGFDGVDKRIDVLATALRAGMTVYDLEELELAYAPPYGSAKDPVNMAGFVASNLLNGDLELWHAEDYRKVIGKGQIIDMRPPQAYKNWHIPGAINIPLRQLRDRIDEGDERLGVGPLYLYCQVGFTSYMAYRILHQRGFDQVYSLAGGALTFMLYHRNKLVTGKPPEPFWSYAEHRIAERDGA